jgi:hypothetical protein
MRGVLAEARQRVLLTSHSSIGLPHRTIAPLHPCLKKWTNVHLRAETKGTTLTIAEGVPRVLVHRHLRAMLIKTVHRRGSVNDA